jgi:spore germination cell wall hydrolase CwlJ-like protein
MIAEAIVCLALNVYFEARGESELGKRAVAYVTVNRTTNNNEVCKVIREPGQFSWLPAKQPIKDKKAFEDAKRIAREVLKDTSKRKDPTSGATYFHNEDVHPKWAKKFKRTLKVGKHNS